MRFPYFFSIGGFTAATAYVAGCVGAPATHACDATAPHVVVTFSGEWDSAVKEEALSDLSAALAPQQMSVCTNQGHAESTQAAAVVATQLMEGAQVRIEVDDALTKKRVSRDVNLKDPKDLSSALIVAVAIDELLRATWAELSMDRETDATPEPTQSERAKEEPPPQEPTRARARGDLPRHRLAWGASVDAYPRATTFWGGDIVYGSALGLVEWSVYGGPRFARSAGASSLGEVQAEALVMGGVIGLPLLRQRSLTFGPEFAVQAARAWFRGRVDNSSEVSAEAGEFQGWSLVASTGFSLRALLGHAFVNVATRVGVPVLALEVTDDDGVVGGMTGLSWTNHVSLGWWWE